jgi:hypothetical protein
MEWLKVKALSSSPSTAKEKSNVCLLDFCHINAHFPMSRIGTGHEGYHEGINAR